MKNVPHSLIAFTSLLVLLLPVWVFASQPIDFSDAKTVEELILNKSWACEMIDNYGESVGAWKFNSVSRNKVKGSVEVPHLPICNSDILKGKLKKNILKYNAPNGTPCREVKGVLKFEYDENNEAKATGTYKIGGTHKGGSYICKLMN